MDDYEIGALTANQELQKGALRALLDESRDTEQYAGLARALIKVRLRLSYADLIRAERMGLL
jgi:hypothetical protein